MENETIKALKDALLGVCVKDASETKDGKPCWCHVGYKPTPGFPHSEECAAARKAFAS